MNQPKIAIHGLHKYFGTNKVLQGIDVEVYPSESLVIIGGSGSGKSVMLKCILGLVEPDQGTIKIDGAEMTTASVQERQVFLNRVGMLFQSAALFDSLSVWENIAFGLVQAQKKTRTQAYILAMETLKAVGLEERIGQLYPAELSGGMKKRVGLARAIATNPDIIFFDEPTTGLDPIMSDVINTLIIKCTKQLGATTISITHDMMSARKIGDRIAMLYQGRVIWCGTSDELDTTDNPYVIQFYHGRAEGPIQPFL